MTDLKANLPKDKHTALGLYVTAKEACEKWRAAPEQVKIIDVRAPEEFLFGGHPEMAWKIPIAAQSHEWDAEKKQFPIKLLSDFVYRVKEVAAPDETILVICRSGGRQRHRVQPAHPGRLHQGPQHHRRHGGRREWGLGQHRSGRMEELRLSLDQETHP